MPRTVAYKAGGFTNYGISYTKFSQEELAEMKDSAMKENEAKQNIITYATMEAENLPMGMGKAFDIAIKALEEVQQYREIGEISTCRVAVEICRAMIERGIEPENIEAYIAFEDKCVQKGFTIKGLLEAGEKQTAKRPREYEDKYYDCPTCGNVLLHKWEKYPDKLMDKSNGLPYCLGCGQKLDWSDEE